MTDNRPLVVAADDTVREEILRLAAAVGCETRCADSTYVAPESWSEAPLVFVDEDAAAACDHNAPPAARVVVVCKSAPTHRAWRSAFLLGAADVVALPDGEATLVATLADIAEGTGTEHGPVLAVVGGRGGAGASVFAAGVAVAAARSGGDALLVDCDPLGGGADLVLGVEANAGLRWPGLTVSGGRVSMSELDAAIPHVRYGDGRLSVLSCDRDGHAPAAGAVTAVVDAGRRSGRVVVCDLPRQVDSGADAALRRADLVVLVVPAEVRACVSARRVLKCLGERAPRVHVVVRGPAPDGLAAHDVATAVGAPLLGWMPAERGLPAALERGVFDPRPRGPLGRTAQAALDMVTGRA